MSKPRETKRERERRDWVVCHEQFKDLEEQYQHQHAQSTDPAERRKLEEEFAAKRRAHREADIALGKRLPGTGVAVRQTMWLNWLEIAVENEMAARRSFEALLRDQTSDPLRHEFHASLIAVTASAHAIEAVFGEIKYLIPPLPQDDRHSKLRQAFQLSFGITDPDDAKLAEELAWLFALRDSAVHPYTELIPTEQHPAGPHSGVEHARFNAVTSGRAVDTVMIVIQLAAAPRNPYNHWIARWVTERVTSALGTVEGLQQLRASSRLEASSLSQGGVGSP